MSDEEIRGLLIVIGVVMVIFGFGMAVGQWLL